LQRVLDRIEGLEQEVLEIRSGDPLAARFASFGARSRIAAPRVALLNPRSVAIGDDVEIMSHLCIEALAPPERTVLRIGNRVVIGHHVRFVALNGIELEDDCGVAHGCTISDTTHDWRELDDSGMQRTPLKLGTPLRIESGAMVGTGCIIAGGLTIGARSVIGANSVVTRDVPPDTLVSGNPARRLPYPKE